MWRLFIVRPMNACTPQYDFRHLVVISGFNAKCGADIHIDEAIHHHPETFFWNRAESVHVYVHFGVMRAIRASFVHDISGVSDKHRLCCDGS